MENEVMLKNYENKLKIVAYKKESNLVLLSLVFLAWVSLFAEKRYKDGTINLLLSLTWIGGLIHAAIISDQKNRKLKHYIELGYRPTTVEDQKKIEQWTSYKVEIIEHKV